MLTENHAPSGIETTHKVRIPERIRQVVLQWGPHRFRSIMNGAVENATKENKPELDDDDVAAGVNATVGKK